MGKDKAVTFRATFPAIGSAIKISGDGNGARIQLDVPEVDLPALNKLLTWRNGAFALQVTIAPEREQPI